MANNTQMNENERGIFALNGITGMLVAVVLLLVILATLVTNAVLIQQRESTNAYQINQDLQGLKANSPENHKQYEIVGNKK
jgi:hypothetical protein